MNTQIEPGTSPKSGPKSYLKYVVAAFVLGIVVMVPIKLYQSKQKHQAEQIAAMASQSSFLSSLDTNKDGELSLDEVVEATVKNVMLFDKDKSGSLDPAEFSVSLGLTGGASQDAAFYHIAFKEADLNKDGVLTPDEIRAYITPGLAEMFAAGEGPELPAKPQPAQ